MPKRYKFQFNGDVESCMALASLLKDGWEVASCGYPAFAVADGYHWINLVKWEGKTKLPNALRQDQ